MAGEMTKCKTCLGNVSTNAETCPHCGAKLKHKRGCFGKLLILGIVVMALVVVGLALSPTEVPVAEKEIVPISNINYSEINDIYKLGSAYTDIQKEKAWEKYKNKKVQWSGEVNDVNESYGNIKLGVKIISTTVFYDLSITLNDSEKEKALLFSKGDTITFTGILDDWGTLVPITLKEGEILN